MYLVIKNLPMRRPNANKAMNKAFWYDSSQTIPKSSVIDDVTTLWSYTSSDLGHITVVSLDKSFEYCNYNQNSMSIS